MRFPIRVTRELPPRILTYASPPDSDRVRLISPVGLDTAEIRTYVPTYVSTYGSFNLIPKKKFQATPPPPPYRTCDPGLGPNDHIMSFDTIRT